VKSVLLGSPPIIQLIQQCSALGPPPPGMGAARRPPPAAAAAAVWWRRCQLSTLNLAMFSLLLAKLASACV
jgi:hypothetical protein